MNWKDYSYLANAHAFLSPSRYHWIRYDPVRLADSYENHKRTALGTRYHNVASELIKLRLRMPDTTASLNSFVNDGIGFGMESEQILFYSVNCYGTADAISFHNKVLRIHDLKTGVTPGSMDQLMIYAALFCLDYSEEPEETYLRIYQGGEIQERLPDYQEIVDVMARIIEADNVITKMEEGIF